MCFGVDRGQGLNHCICDITYLIDAIQRVRAGDASFSEAITAYDEEIVPRGREEVKCSVENGFMLHDWELVQQSPVFTNGFRPMTGHDKEDAAAAVSEHAQVRKQQEEEDRRVAAQ